MEGRDEMCSETLLKTPALVIWCFPSRQPAAFQPCWMCLSPRTGTSSTFSNNRNGHRCVSCPAGKKKARGEYPCRLDRGLSSAALLSRTYSLRWVPTLQWDLATETTLSVAPTPQPKSEPKREYEKRFAARTAVLERRQQLFVIVSNWRLVCVLAVPLMAWLSWGRDLFSPWWLALPLAAFVALAVYHEFVDRRIQGAKRAVCFYEHGLARLGDRWSAIGDRGERFADPNHLYASDLDVFGEGSLFQLLCTARTRAGESALADCLCRPASPGEILSRQEAVEELRHKLDLREELALLGADVRSGLHPEALSRWAARPAAVFPTGVRWLAFFLSAVTFASLAPLFLETPHLTPFAIALLLEATFAVLVRSRVNKVIEAVDSPARDLGLLSDVLSRLEAEKFDSRLLKELRARLDTADRPASVRIARLERLVEYLEWRGNNMFTALARMLFWGTQFALVIEAWRRESGPHIEKWLRAVGEIEALCALSGYAYENPDDPFPELAEESCFDAEGLGHPLMARAELVRNDLSIGGDLRLLVVSGSNMSGKSTLLRSVGLNAALAQAGAPVRARRLRLSPLAIGASMRPVDSLQEHTSRFYAEIKRLRAIVALTEHELPVVFLLDEILSGTNSHDRRIGAEAVVKALVERGSIGLVTTHDLALTKITEQLGVRAANVHFEDRLENGTMIFDFKMRLGVVERSNALDLMRSIGLDV